MTEIVIVVGVPVIGPQLRNVLAVLSSRVRKQFYWKYEAPSMTGRRTFTR